MTSLLASIRASSWSDLLDCSLRWYAKHVLGMNRPASAASHLGTSLHVGTAAFDSARLPGASQISADDAAGAFVDALHHPKEEVERTDDDLPLKDAERIGIALTARYCTELAPKQTYIAVEHSFESLDVQTEHGTLRFSGTADRIRETADGKRGIADVKSGKRAVEGIKTSPRAVTDKHGPQIGIYTLLAEQSLGYALDAPGQIIGLQTTSSAAVATGEIEQPKLTLLGDDEHPGLIDIAARMMKEGIFIPNPGSMTCSSRYCPYWDRCVYRPR